KEKGMADQEITAILQVKSRDNSRTPVQWDDTPNGGFTKGTPWIPVAGNYREINA
ncbi:alpha,alpha-phosphotrehalase, partial [Bacillus inaquosorum]|nr:alpha,alpha-phosphotrehalase [Bacillus inaquosorum]